MFDTHCHVDLYPNPAELVARCEAERIYTIAVTNAPSVFAATEQLTLGKKYVRPAAGLHPELVSERWRELDVFWEALRSTRYVGEIGLDYTRPNDGDRRRQRDVFSQILERCDEMGGKILTVHSRRAADDVVDAIPERFRGAVILHWFSGSLRALRRGLEKGCHFSVNPAMVSRARFPRMLQEIPQNRILLETDGPFVQVGGRVAWPGDVRDVAARLSGLWRLNLEEGLDILGGSWRRMLETTV